MEEGRNFAKACVFLPRLYNQLTRFGQFDDSLDRELQKNRNRNSPETFAALDKAATQSYLQLDSQTFENLCWYLSFLWNMCPFAKAVAPVHFVEQIMLDLRLGKIDRLRALGHTESNIAAIQKFHNEGYKLIITGKNYLQLVYRIVFNDHCRETYRQFRFITQWTVYNSPIELPISDIALIKFLRQKSEFECSMSYLLHQNYYWLEHIKSRQSASFGGDWCKR